MSNKSYKTKDRIYGIAIIICIAIFSICIYSYTLSILSVAAVYSFLMIRTITVVYSRYLGYLDNKSNIIIGILSFFIICIGYYVAYAIYYYSYLHFTKNCSFLYIVINLTPLLNSIDKELAPGSLFFILFSFICGMAMNKQYIKHEQVDDLNKRLIEFKKQFGIENEKEKDSKLKKIIIKLIIVGFLTLGLGVYNDYRFNQYLLIKRYQKELSELKIKNKEAYDRAKEVLIGQGGNYYYCSYDYYVRGERNLLNITADLDGDDYCLYYDQESHGTILEMTWGDWTEDVNKKEYINITLDVKAKGEGYAIIHITNDVNDYCINVFVDNFNY